MWGGREGGDLGGREIGGGGKGERGWGEWWGGGEGWDVRLVWWVGGGRFAGGRAVVRGEGAGGHAVRLRGGREW